MKILSLRFKNINALKGTFEVDFTRPPLSEAGLFAITGPTGSGKTTLLDVLCLALYNQVPRLGKISKNTIEQSGAIVTRHTDTAFAEATYACHEGVFTSRWSISTARTGNLRDYEMEISQADGTLLDLKKSEVPATNARLIGLTYDQFTRSTLLAQGAFAKFLMADQNERSALLEQITGTEIYRTLGKMAFEKYNQVGKELKRLREWKEQLGQEQLSKDALQQLNEELQQIDREASDLKKEQAQTGELLQQWSRVHEIRKRISTCEAKLEQALGEKASFDEVKGQALAAHDALAPIGEALDDWRNQKDRLQELCHQQEVLLEDLAKGEKAQETLLQKAATLVKQPLTAETVSSALTAFTRSVTALMDKLRTLQQDYKAIQQRLGDKLTAAQVPWSGKYTSTTVAVLTDFQEQLTAAIADLQQALPASFIADPANALLRVQQISGQLYNRQHMVQAIVKLEEDQRQYGNMREEIHNELQVLPQQIAAGEKELALARTNLALLEEQRQRIAAQHDLAALRASLESGEPCPLCGSTTHPLVTHEGDTPPAQEALHDARQHRDNCQQTVAMLEAKQLNLQEKITQLNEEEKERAQQLAEKKADLLQLSQSLDTYWLTDDPQVAIDNQQIIQQQLTDWMQKHVQQKAVDEAMPLCEQLDTIHAEGQTTKEELGALYTGDDIAMVTDGMKEQWQQVTARLETITQQYAEVKQSVQNKAAAFSELEQSLVAQIGTLGYVEVQEAAAVRLTESEAMAWRNEQGEIERSLTALRSEQTLLQTTVANELAALQGFDEDALRDSAAAISEQLTQLEVRKRPLTSAIDRQQQIATDLRNLATQMASEEKTNEKWRLLSKYIGCSTGNVFARFAQGLTLKQLTMLANRRLEKITGRYWLDTPEKDEDDSLIVIDRDMGDERRSVKTLSGGETFLVSLALALALSDLAAHTVKIESIFIDEGFGTLDPEILDQTLDVLERLQLQDNKTIGIISHVTSLKERITTQIQLQQDGQGYSTLKIV